MWALRRRERNQIDRWDGVTYRRVIVVEGRATELAIPASTARCLVLEALTDVDEATVRERYAGLLYFHLLLHGHSETGIFEQKSVIPVERSDDAVQAAGERFSDDRV